MEKHGYSLKKIDGVTYFMGISWNPEFVKPPLVEREPLDFSYVMNKIKKSKNRPVYKYIYFDHKNIFLNRMQNNTSNDNGNVDNLTI